MMTVERVSLQMVQEEVKAFMDANPPDPTDEDYEFDEDEIKQSHIDEMNTEITGGDVTQGSASSYVPRTIWSVLADDDIVDEDMEDKFIAFYEQTHA